MKLRGTRLHQGLLLTAVLTVAGVTLGQAPGRAQIVQATVVANNLPSPIGLGCASGGRLIVSVNWPDFPAAPNTTGPGPLYNLRQVVPSWTAPNSGSQFSTLMGIFDEVKLAVSPGVASGYGDGTIYYGSNAGYSGQHDAVTGNPLPIPPEYIGRVSSDGSVVQKFWCALPGSDHIVTGLKFDTTGQFGGFLYALTEDGKVYRITSAGVATMIANIRPQFADFRESEGLVLIPNDVVRYGPLAGKIVCGGEDRGRLYLVNAGTGTATILNVPGAVHPEDLILAVANADFYGVDHAANAVLGLKQAQLTSAGVLPGDLLIADEFASSAEVPGSAPLWRIAWNSSTQSWQAREITVAQQWEQVTFCVHAATFTFCPLTQGYWKNHTSAWPVNHLTIGGKTYTAAQLETILQTPPKGGNAVLILAHQLIAAELNIAAGADPTPVASAITQANNLLTGINLTTGFVSSSSSLGQQMTAIADLLDKYNSGLLTNCSGGG